MSDLCFDPDTFVESLGEDEAQKGENSDKTRHWFYVIEVKAVFDAWIDLRHELCVLYQTRIEKWWGLAFVTTVE